MVCVKDDLVHIDFDNIALDQPLECLLNSLEIETAREVITTAIGHNEDWQLPLVCPHQESIDHLMHGSITTTRQESTVLREVNLLLGQVPCVHHSLTLIEGDFNAVRCETLCDQGPDVPLLS